MNLEEARKIIWIKTNPRPMGELLDNGFLTKSRLEWTTRKAYDPKLREAAQVLLDSFDAPAVQNKAATPTNTIAPTQIGLPLEKARAILWPFSPYKGQPMGILVDAKQLSIKDLGYAIDNARDEKVKQAAIALMLVRLEQAVKEPVPSAGFVKVTSSGRSYAQRTETRLTLIQGMILGSLVILMLALFLWGLLDIFKSRPDARSFNEVISEPAGIIALILVLIGFFLLFWLLNYLPNLIFKRIDKKIHEQRLGQEGEDQVAQLISQVLDGNWHLFRNMNLPGRNQGDLDMVLVGPPGIWALEVKNYNGMYRNIGDLWEVRKGKKWEKTFKNPSRQAEANSLNLRNFLKADNIHAFVNPVVAWANPESSLSVENPMVSIWQYTQLPDELGNIWQGEKLSQAERNKIIEKFTKLCERHKDNHSDQQ